MRSVRDLIFVKVLLAFPLLFSSPSRAAVVCDTKAREVRVPFTFVAPAQAIEVFGCSPGGPTHETVIKFRASGKEIAQALEKLGLREETFWLASGKDDYYLTQGDRVLVILKWRYGGRDWEVPAEDLLWRSGEDLPELIFGFSYSGRRVQAGDSPKREIPDVVEITMGGTGRQSAVTSLLIHPTAFPHFLAEYVSPIELNPRYAQQVTAMAEAGEGGTMILRPVTESQLIDYRLSKSPPFWGFQHVLEEARPIAAQIDETKKAFVKVRNELAALLAESSPGDKKKVQEKLLEARSLAWRTAQLYVSMYEKVWRFSRKILQDRLASFNANWDRGYSFLLQYLPERRKLAELKLAAFREGMNERYKLQIECSRQRLEEIRAQREKRVWGFQLEDLKKRLEEARAQKSDYLVRLFENEIWKTRLRYLKAHFLAKQSRLQQERLTCRLKGTEEPPEAEGQLGQVEKELACLRIEEKLCELAEKMRWVEEDLQSESSERRSRAAEEIEKLRAEEKRLTEELKEKGCTLHKTVPVEEQDL